MSEALTPSTVSRETSAAGPERPGPQGQERI